ncbi:UDP-2,4-diacetamido-2,4,6-trideoxy-beta-L-altropyranose hydrolase [Hyphomicrobium sp.]|uniref:UDP-2,4-diacetamido-2,4, 6-trideoxy-beta-L-altropyranose hydrolase n=1 Tax=Hyphomicrobium sp. TaxID=82 RepID=UPI0025C65ACE|nr:UDP-2,4-diacetamido-2,4,6-trideoxy-beta-L-altropyranose hydrolase [Hyphomicrobium sp.]MCC7250953.1 UDP-2,4-diacetamido-2,4,6-trideoxy-beta-L-altropyranose hydrolase [Hyphomicrobium sp.]
MQGNAIFRCDASPTIGGGHVMRSVALAERFHDRGWTVAFLVKPETVRYVPIGSFRDFIVLEASEDILHQVAQIKMVLGAVDIVVIDSYELDREYEAVLRDLGGRILVVDDIETREHDCDWLLDASQDRDSQKYKGLVPDGCIRLFGPDYVCIRADIKIHRSRLAKVTNGAEHAIFVSFGASDSGGGTQLALDAFGELSPPPALSVATSGANPIVASLRNRPNVRLFVDTADIGGAMAASSIGVGAAGVAAWERCFLGVPSIILSTAENQVSIANTIARAGAALYLGAVADCAPKLLASEIRRLLDSPELRETMRENALRLVDGLGADRIIDAVIV